MGDESIFYGGITNFSKEKLQSKIHCNFPWLIIITFFKKYRC